MKHIIFLLLSVGVAVAADVSHSSGPDVRVVVQSEARDLALGYAQAFASIGHTPVTLGYARDGVVWVLEDVRGVKDAEGVVIVEVGKGLTYIINARDVLYVTDGSAPKAK